MNLTYLDLGFYNPEDDSNNKIYQLFEITPFLEEIGYKRIWLGEHHSYDCAWRSPEILIPLLLAATNKIKVGSAGNLLRLHNPLRLVQDYSLLEGLFRERVDMGISSGSAELKVRNALTNGTHEKSFVTKIEELFGFFNDAFDHNKSYNIISPPYVDKLKPSIWFLSSSNSKFDFAIKNKANYVWSLFHSKKEYWPKPDCILEFENLYYKVNKELPDTAIAIAGICLKDKKRVKNLTNRFKKNVHITVSGSRSECTSQINQLIMKYKGIKELVIADLSLSIDDKKESCTNFKEIIDELTL